MGSNDAAHEDARRLPASAHTNTPSTALAFSCLFVLTLAAQLLALAFGRIDAKQDLMSMLLPSVLYLSAITVPACWSGLRLGPPLGLGATRLAGRFVHRTGVGRALRQDVLIAGGAGLLLGVLLLLVHQLCRPFLPAAVPELGFRGVLGSFAVSLGAAVGEEVWFRLGLMTLLIWAVTRLAGRSTPSSPAVWSIISIAAIGFGAAHVPQLIAYGGGSPFAIAATVLGNTAVGLLYGWCYWRRGLFAAMVAHFSVDLVMHVLPAAV